MAAETEIVLVAERGDHDDPDYQRSITAGYELHVAMARFAGAIEPEQAVEVAHAADEPKPMASDTFSLTPADAKLLTGDLSAYDHSAEKAMESLLALDQRLRDWLKEESSS